MRESHLEPPDVLGELLDLPRGGLLLPRVGLALELELLRDFVELLFHIEEVALLFRHSLNLYQHALRPLLLLGLDLFEPVCGAEP